MARMGQRVVATSEVRRELTAGGDLRSTIDFQNEVNVLIAAVARLDTEQEGRGLADVQAPYGVLPPQAVNLQDRRRMSHASAALRSLVISSQARYRRMTAAR
jgi:hypothetical protein